MLWCLNDSGVTHRVSVDTAGFTFNVLCFIALEVNQPGTNQQLHLLFTSLILPSSLLYLNKQIVKLYASSSPVFSHHDAMLEVKLCRGMTRCAFTTIVLETMRQVACACPFNSILCIFLSFFLLGPLRQPSREQGHVTLDPTISSRRLRDTTSAPYHIASRSFTEKLDAKMFLHPRELPILCQDALKYAKHAQTRLCAVGTELIQHWDSIGTASEQRTKLLPPHRICSTCSGALYSATPSSVSFSPLRNHTRLNTYKMFLDIRRNNAQYATVQGTHKIEME